ncbi:MAG: TIGR01212 family radical SAM protein [Methylotenera sp.]|nr:TIGR01212 family radical SAM protein [Oligoflexia bacterium]
MSPLMETVGNSPQATKPSAKNQWTETHYPYSRYLEETFGGKTYKIVVASGLTCPTRDGTIAKAGCAFCDIRGSSSYFGKQGRGASVKEQIRSRMPGVEKRFGAKGYLAYFQSYTNTYSDVNYLREIYEAALSEPEISGLCIGTRPDCLPDPVIDLLEELATTHYVSLELGVQSFEDESLLWLERGHDSKCSIDMLAKLRVRAPTVHTCVHLMFGQPTDTEGGPAEAARILNGIGVRGAKLHQLMVLEHTKLADLYRREPFKTLTLEEYTDQVIEFVENLSPSIYIERLSATASHPDECLAPKWSCNRWDPHNKMRDIMTARGCVQGKRLILT